jgi:uncharacterized membrane protein YfcA
VGEFICVVGYLAAAFIGVTLGLMGSGGSTLTVPVLVFVLGIEPVQATGYSLFIVGVTALVGTVRNGLSGTLDLRPASTFGVASVAAVYVMRRFLMPAIPDPLFSAGALSVSKNTAVLVLFAVLMLASSLSMIRAKNHVGTQSSGSPAVLALFGLLVGVITGAVGAGGGFLIVPALVLIGGIPMKRAVPTSLAIIAMNTGIGFIGELHSAKDLDWPFVLMFSAFTIAGLLIGARLSGLLPSRTMRPAFGYFILAMGLFTLASATIHPT